MNDKDKAVWFFDTNPHYSLPEIERRDSFTQIGTTHYYYYSLNYYFPYGEHVLIPITLY